MPLSSDLAVESRERTVGRRRARACVAVVATAALAGSLVQTLVVPLVPSFPQYFDTDPGAIAWVVTVTFVSAGVSTPLLSRLGDRFGRKRLLLVSIAILAIGSSICALSSTMPWLLVGRGLQGAGMAIVPLGISIVAGLSSLNNTNTSIGIVSSVLGVGGAIGLPLAGITARYLDFHAIFAINAAMAVVAGVAVALVVPESAIHEGGKVDLPGIVTLAALLAAAFLVIANGPDWGLTSVPTISLSLVAGLILLPALVIIELRARQPAVDLRALAVRPVLLTNMASILVGFVMFENFYTTTQLVQVPEIAGYGFGLDAAAAGLCVLPTGLAVMIFAPAAGRVIHRLGCKGAILLGLTILGLGPFVRLIAGDALTMVIASSTIVGIGTAVTFATMPALVLQSTPPGRTSAATGLNTLARTLGSALASAVTGVILSTVTTTVDGATFPGRVGFEALSLAAVIGSVVGLCLIAAIPARRTPPTHAARSSPA